MTGVEAMPPSLPRLVIVIVDPDLGEEQREGVFDKIRELIPQKGGLVVEFDEWGGRKLAYEIKKKSR